jgi:hypothetical protein
MIIALIIVFVCISSFIWIFNSMPDYCEICGREAYVSKTYEACKGDPKKLQRASQYPVCERCIKK